MRDYSYHTLSFIINAFEKKVRIIPLTFIPYQSSLMVQITLHNIRLEDDFGWPLWVTVTITHRQTHTHKHARTHGKQPTRYKAIPKLKLTPRTASYNTEKVMHTIYLFIQFLLRVTQLGRLLDQAVNFLNCVPFQNGNFS